MEKFHDIPIWGLLPFILMLASIAVFPLAAPVFWGKNKNKLIIALILSIPTAIYMITIGGSHEVVHSVVNDYIPFLVLLGSLFIVTGGIFVDGDIEATPLTNTTFLAIGAILASLMGTTGAAMLLIRPVLKTNSERKYKVHTVLFFIAIVANCGGLLTPLGDPPLFMMYLRGAPFLWFTSLWKEWLTTNVLLLIIYFVIDNINWKKEPIETKFLDKTNIQPIKIYGKLNFIWLLGIILGVALINESTFEFIKTNENFGFLREAFLMLMALLSLKFTMKSVREKNSFNWEPIQEVAYLFFGIFITMVPALEYLKINAGSLGITDPAHFYYASGALSSFLDNTPTAVTFYSLELGVIAQNAAQLVQGHIVAGIPDNIMSAICTGAVFFGSMTYIGNGPNFMVKAIAEDQNTKMPDFFSYIFKFSLILLLPIFIIIHLLFI